MVILFYEQNTVTRRKVTNFHVVSLLLLIYSYGSAIDVISSFPDEHILTKEGSKLTLSCASSIPWFFCLWHSPIGNKECAIQESEVRGVCTGKEDSNMYLYGVQDSCSLHIENITREGHGEWMCLLNDIQEFDSAKQKVKVNVAVPAKIGIETIGGGHFNSSINKLEIMEGEHTEIVCRATSGYPQPTFSWFYSLEQDLSEISLKSPSGDLQRILQPVHRNMTKDATVYSSPNSLHFYDGEQSLMYEAKLTDNGMNLSCKISKLARRRSLFTYCNSNT